MIQTRVFLRLTMLALIGCAVQGCVAGPMEGSCRGPRPGSYFVVGQEGTEAAIWIVDGPRRERIKVQGVQ